MSHVGNCLELFFLSYRCFGVRKSDFMDGTKDKNGLKKNAIFGKNLRTKITVATR